MLTAAVSIATAAGLHATEAQNAIGQPTPQGDAALEQLVAQLESLGLRVTVDKRTIGEATGEAAYFMFAERKDHRPRCKAFSLPEKGQWLEGKPVFTRQADKEKIYPLFNRLASRMGYDKLCIYNADVRYGVNSRAVFTLYKLGYSREKPRRGKMPELLLGDADYVINLP